MKPSKSHTIKILFLLAALYISASSCTIETDGSGKLGGFWHLTTMENLSDTTIKDMTEESIFYSVQGRIFEVRNSKKEEYIMFKYEHVDDSLFLSEARVNNRDLNDSLITDPNTLIPYGISSPNERFYIEKLGGGKMILKSKVLRLYFRKF